MENKKRFKLVIVTAIICMLICIPLGISIGKKFLRSNTINNVISNGVNSENTIESNTNDNVNKPDTNSNSNEQVCENFINATYKGEYYGNDGKIAEAVTLTLNEDGTYLASYKDSELERGNYTISNNI